MDIYQQLKQRRRQLELTQQDMAPRTGMSRQQYQRLEAGGNPRLDTLALAAEGLNAELMLIPREKRHAVLTLLSQHSANETSSPSADVDPWHGLLGESDP